MPDDYTIDDLHTYGLIVAAGGLSAAARRHGLPKSSLSRSLARLEQVAGAPLFDRLGRGLRLTPLGETLRAVSERALELGQEAEDALRSVGGEPSGPLRLAASSTLAQQLLAPMLGRFTEAFPDVEVSLWTTNHGPNPLTEDLDIAFRLGRPSDPRLVARRVVSSPRRLYAERGRAAGMDVTDPAAVRRLGRVVVTPLPMFAPSDADIAWRLSDAEGRTLVLDDPPQLVVDDPAVALGVLLAGTGTACLPSAYAEEAAGGDRLVRLLPRHESAGVEIYATLPPRRARVPAVRAFIDMLVEHVASVGALTDGRTA